MQTDVLLHLTCLSATGWMISSASNFYHALPNTERETLILATKTLTPCSWPGQALVILLHFASILACLLWQTRIKRDERDDVELQSEIKMADKKNMVCLLVFMYACLT